MAWMKVLCFGPWENFKLFGPCYISVRTFRWACLLEKGVRTQMKVLCFGGHQKKRLSLIVITRHNIPLDPVLNIVFLFTNTPIQAPP